jgi:hypothetical protein
VYPTDLFIYTDSGLAIDPLLAGVAAGSNRAIVSHWTGEYFFQRKEPLILKGHGNEADFLGFLHKLDPHRFLTLSFQPFRFWLQIRGDIRNRKTTPRLAESGSGQDCLYIKMFSNL